MAYLKKTLQKAMKQIFFIDWPVARNQINTKLIYCARSVWRAVCWLAAENSNPFSDCCIDLQSQAPHGT